MTDAPPLGREERHAITQAANEMELDVTQICKDWLHHGQCRKPYPCRFLHPNHEISAIHPFMRVALRTRFVRERTCTTI